MAQPPDPQRSQSTTSLSRLYNGSNGRGINDDELNDPGLDYCNAFWGQGERGYEVVMARLRGANRTTDELRSFWKERAAIEEDYAKRLAKLSKYPLGRDEIGELAASLQNVLVETSQQASYHLSLSTEIKQTVEQPTAEFQSRLSNLKKGLQASVEKSYRNKGLQEGHVQKAKEKYESDCLKLNSYTANSALSQGRDLEKVQSKLDRVRQTIGGNEQDFRQFVKVLEGTTQKWEAEWRGFCDHVQDLEEDRMVLMKDITWAFANAVSQVCVEDDGSCERIREKLETFEPANDMVAFVRGWGTGDQIPDPPRFINYSAGEYPQQPTFHPARFQRLSSKPPLSAVSAAAPQHQDEPQQEEEDQLAIPPVAPEPDQRPNGLSNGFQSMSLHDQGPQPVSSPPPIEKEPERKPFGGVALPGMGAMAGAAAASSALPERTSSMPPPPVPPQMSMPEPRVPSRQGPPSPGSRDVNDETDPMARALAELRREPPGPGSIRRNASHRRPESVTAGSMRSGINPTASPGPGQRMSYQQQQQPPSSQGHGQGGPPRQQSIDMTLSPPAPGHTAAQLAKSMDDFQRSASRAADKRGSVNYSNYADDVVGAHPASRPASPAAISPSAGRSPSPAMMQAPTQPATHIADEVLSQYHQSFPGERRERSRSRAASIMSGGGGSRPGSVFNAPAAQQQSNQPPPSPRQGFVGIGAGGGRSPSPGPPMQSPPPPSGGLGPQSLGIALDKSGGVAHDSMAEAYRRQYQESQQQSPQQQPQTGRPGSQYGQQQQYGGQQQQPGYAPQQSPQNASFNGRPTSGYGGPPQQQQYNQPPPQQQQYQQYQAPPQPSYQTHPSYQQQPPPQADHGPNGYGQQPQGYGRSASPAPQQPQQYGRSASPAPQHQQQYGRSVSPAPQQQYGRSASPAPQQQNYGYRAPSPQPQQQQQQPRYNRTPSPQPGYGGPPQPQQAGRSPSPQPNQPPPNTAPTGQWSTTGLPVLFYVKALYDYAAQSAAEFDFQSGDIIAVTSTPEDGWWSGELLDEARRLPGRTDFPSNFVCLF